MERLEDRLADEVRKYKHMYDPSAKNYKNSEVIGTSWREIGEVLDKDPEWCIKKWKAMRDKFVRLKKKLKTQSGDPAHAGSRVPEHFIRLSWLHGFVKHREVELNLSDEVESDSGNHNVSSPKEKSTPPLYTRPVEEEPIDRPSSQSRQVRSLSRLRRRSSQRPVSGHPVCRPSRVCSDDDNVSTASSAQSVPVRQQAKRTRGPPGEDILETIAALRREQTASYATVVSQLSADPRTTWDEFSTFALAVADSLRKLPADRVEATKVKLFHVLGEAHTL